MYASQCWIRCHILRLLVAAPGRPSLFDNRAPFFRRAPAPCKDGGLRAPFRPLGFHAPGAHLIVGPVAALAHCPVVLRIGWIGVVDVRPVLGGRTAGARLIGRPAARLPHATMAAVVPEGLSGFPAPPFPLGEHLLSRHLSGSGFALGRRGVFGLGHASSLSQPSACTRTSG